MSAAHAMPAWMCRLPQAAHLCNGRSVCYACQLAQRVRLSSDETLHVLLLQQQSIAYFSRVESSSSIAYATF